MESKDAKADAFIEIPGETTLWKTVDIAPERVDFPFAAGPHTIGQSIQAALGLVIGLPSIVGAAMLLLHSGAVEGAMLAVPLVVGPSLGLLGLLLTEFGINIIRNLVSRSPLLVIDETGLWGTRLSHPIRWTDIKRAKIIVRRKSGITGVSLRLKQPVAARRRSFRLGDWLERFFGEPDLVYVPVTLLSRSRHTLSQAITRMAEKHGAEIVPPEPER